MRKWLTQKRLEKNETLSGIADMTGMSESYLCQIEQGTRRPSPEKAKKIAEVLGFDWTLFYEE